MTTEQQITARLRVAKTPEDSLRAEFVGEPVFGMTGYSNPNFVQFENGTIIEVTLRKYGDHMRMVGIVRAVDEAEEADIENTDWVQVDTEYFAPEEYSLFKVAMQVLSEGEPFRLMLAGPSGYGKTSRAKAWACANNMDYVRINCAMIRDPEEWYIYREARANDNGGTDTVVELTRLSNALINGNAVIVLDEINRLEPWLSNSLFSLLDMDQQVDAHGVNITVGDNVLFAMTKNQGAAYVGTFGMDAALQRRVDAQVNVGAPPPHLERKILVEKRGISEDAAYHIIDTLIRMRTEIPADESVNITTGPALKIAMLVKHGRPMRTAFQDVVVNPAPIELQKGLLDMINSRLGAF